MNEGNIVTLIQRIICCRKCYSNIPYLNMIQAHAKIISMWATRIDILVPTWCHIRWTNNVPIVAAKANIAEICDIFPFNAEYFVYNI